MTHRNLRFIVAGAALTAFSAGLHAQAAAEPTAYTVSLQIQFTGPKAQIKIWRLGPKKLVDQTNPPDPDEKQSETRRTLYNLDTKESFSWNPLDPSAPCVRSQSVPPEWQDPFGAGPDLAMKDIAHVGHEKVLGIDSVILESKKDPEVTKRLWVDPRTGLMLKAQFISKKLGGTLTYFEVTEFSLTPPPASIFQVPASCR